MSILYSRHEVTVTSYGQDQSHTTTTVMTTPYDEHATATKLRILDKAKRQCDVAFTRSNTMYHCDGVRSTHTTLHDKKWRVCSDVRVISSMC